MSFECNQPERGWQTAYVVLRQWTSLCTFINSSDGIFSFYRERLLHVTEQILAAKIWYRSSSCGSFAPPTTPAPVVLVGGLLLPSPTCLGRCCCSVATPMNQCQVVYGWCQFSWMRARWWWWWMAAVWCYRRWTSVARGCWRRLPSRMSTQNAQWRRTSCCAMAAAARSRQSSGTCRSHVNKTFITTKTKTKTVHAVTNVLTN